MVHLLRETLQRRDKALDQIETVKNPREQDVSVPRFQIVPEDRSDVRLGEPSASGSDCKRTDSPYRVTLEPSAMVEFMPHKVGDGGLADPRRTPEENELGHESTVL